MVRIDRPIRRRRGRVVRSELRVSVGPAVERFAEGRNATPFGARPGCGSRNRGHMEIGRRNERRSQTLEIQPLSLSTKNFLTLNVSYEHIRTFVFCFLRILGP